MLIHSDISINELAKATGYGSDITFRRVFKKYMGMTPSEYASSVKILATKNRTE